MRSAAAWPVAALCLAVLQTAGRAEARPDFLLVAVLLVAVRGGPGAGARCGIALGWLEGVFSPLAPGHHVLVKGLVGCLAGTMRDKLDCENPNTLAMLAVGATALHASGDFLLALFRAEGEPLPGALTGLLPAAVLNGVLLPLAAAGGRALRRRLRRRAQQRAAAIAAAR